MKWNKLTILLMVIVLFSSVTMADDIEVPTYFQRWFLGQTALTYKGFEIVPKLTNDTLLNSRDFEWVVNQSEKSFYPHITANLTEFHYFTNLLTLPEVCINVNPYYTRCTQEGIDLSTFEDKNRINEEVCSLVGIGKDQKETCVKPAIQKIVDQKDEDNNTVGYDIGYYSPLWGITEFDPSFEQIYSSSSNLIGNGTDYWRNQTHATALGVSIMKNVSNWTKTGEPVVASYNYSDGWFNSMVFYNSTSTYWNVTMSLADSNGTWDTFDCCNNSNLVSYWDLDSGGNNASPYGDERGDNNGIPTGTNNATGISSGAIRFDGVDDKINITSGELIGTGADSVCAWIYAKDYGGGANGRIVDNGKFFFFINDADDRIYLWGDASTVTCFGTFSASDLDVWNHVCATRTADGTCNIYKNGVNIATDLDSGTPTAGTTNLYIGNRPANDRGFNGSIDEVLIYNKSLTVSEVEELYKAGLSQHANTNITLETRTASSYNLSDSGLVSFYSFNDDNSTHAIDAMDRHHGELDAGMVATEENGTAGKGYTIDNAHRIVFNNLLADLSGDDSFTITGWFKPNKEAAQMMWTRYGQYTIWGGLNASGGVRFNTGAGKIWTTTNQVPSYRWSYISWVKVDASHVEVYIDGVNQSGSGSVGAIPAMTESMWIGDYPTGGIEYYGGIDEFRVYNRTLTSDEIQNLYELGSYHIEWNEDFTTRQKMEDNVPYYTTSSSEFFQTRYLYETNDTDVSPYLLNHSIKIAEFPAVPITPWFDEIPYNRTLEYYYDNLMIEVNASDDYAFDDYWVNDTTNFNITKDGGILTNATIISAGVYYLQIYINDTTNSINSTVLNINVTDTVYPFITEIPHNRTLEYYYDSLSIQLNTTDLSFDDYFVNDTIRFNITKDGGLFINATVNPIGVYYVNLSFNDTQGYVNSTILNINYSDTTAPRFNETPNDRIIDYVPLDYKINATDFDVFDTFGLNDTTVFNISSEGRMQNNSYISDLVIYHINISINDTSNNTNYSAITIKTEDVIPPSFTTVPPNATLNYYVDNLDVTFIATDNREVDNYFINDTTRFNMSSDGGNLINITTLPIGIYYINVSVNDTTKNQVSSHYNVTVVDYRTYWFNITPDNWGGNRNPDRVCFVLWGSSVCFDETSNTTVAGGGTSYDGYNYKANNTAEMIAAIDQSSLNALHFNSLNCSAIMIGNSTNLCNITVQTLGGGGGDGYNYQGNSSDDFDFLTTTDNTTLVSYITTNNQTIVTYITNNNNSIIGFIQNNNRTLKDFIYDNIENNITYVNLSMVKYVTTTNDSMRTYVIQQNTTMTAYVNAQAGDGYNHQGNATTDFITLHQGNSTKEIRDAINNTTIWINWITNFKGFIGGLQWGNLTGIPDWVWQGNSTAEIISAVDQASFNGLHINTINCSSIMISNTTNLCNITVQNLGGADGYNYQGNVSSDFDFLASINNVTLTAYILGNNNTLISYIQVNNNTLVTYIIDNNRTIKDFIADNIRNNITTINDTLVQYILGNNDTMRDYIIQQNTTMKAYVDASDDYNYQGNSSAEIIAAVNQASFNGSTIDDLNCSAIRIGNSTNLCNITTQVLSEGADGYNYQGNATADFPTLHQGNSSAEIIASVDQASFNGSTIDDLNCSAIRIGNSTNLCNITTQSMGEDGYNYQANSTDDFSSYIFDNNKTLKDFLSENMENNITYVNDSMVDYVTANNATMKDYVDTSDDYNYQGNSSTEMITAIDQSSLNASTFDDINCSAIRMGNTTNLCNITVQSMGADGYNYQGNATADFPTLHQGNSSEDILATINGSDISLLRLNITDNVNINNSVNITQGNITISGWFRGLLNFSWIQNLPEWLYHGNSTSDFTSFHQGNTSSDFPTLHQGNSSAEMISAIDQASLNASTFDDINCSAIRIGNSTNLCNISVQTLGGGSADGYNYQANSSEDVLSVINGSDISLLRLNITDNVNINNSVNITQGNITISGWFRGLLNFSWIQNLPEWLYQGNATSDFTSFHQGNTSSDFTDLHQGNSSTEMISAIDQSSLNASHFNSLNCSSMTLGNSTNLCNITVQNLGGGGAADGYNHQANSSTEMRTAINNTHIRAVMLNVSKNLTIESTNKLAIFWNNGTHLIIT